MAQPRSHSSGERKQCRTLFWRFLDLIAARRFSRRTIGRNAIGLIRRRRLVAWRRIGQAGPRRLAGECAVFFFFEPTEAQNSISLLRLDTRRGGSCCARTAARRDQLIWSQRPAVFHDRVGNREPRISLTGLTLFNVG